MIHLHREHYYSNLQTLTVISKIFFHHHRKYRYFKQSNVIKTIVINEINQYILSAKWYTAIE